MIDTGEVKDPKASRLKIDLRDNDGHVTMATFGLQEVENSELERVYMETGPMRSVVTQMVTRKAYHRDRGISTHQTDDPLDLVRLHPKEDIIEGGPRRTWIRKFINYRIGIVTGLGILEYFELPFDDARFMAELCESKSVQEGIQANQLLNGLR
ncbi:hypothetical protein ST201phi2-1p135 [Pseudomonas phage 201phi2-1]|uniref:Uncharacterized protein n=1 Tax=Pseudomonas phage 201phi2-1 TaxID=198110 RepID=B3FIZ8_BP201|nr:hypothetical protein ST201phi2-1p135 [Pseudomonas phage 201phi2-1]ABY63293.1 hypothetical protein 201phi2-1p135 [Pseudomonas phage 201phi2-1]